jgi:hypothetical protein
MVAILQPFIPDYREEFFQDLGRRTPLDIYCYAGADHLAKGHLAPARVPVKRIRALAAGPFLLYNPFPLLSRRYEVLVLMLHAGHLSTWLLLATRRLHRKKIILWGHGISIRRFLREERRPSPRLRAMIALADQVWFYTGYEQRLWQKIFPRKETVSLNNTISQIRDTGSFDKAALKARHGISQPLVLIFCARFNTTARRSDLLERVIASVDPDRYGFIIIGDGPFKPDFRPYPHVYDFGSVYDRGLKDELFHIADIYFQPAWLGLSVTEAMAYHKPVFTLQRAPDIRQCVEYSYLIDGFNGVIAGDLDQCLRALGESSPEYLDQLSANCKTFYDTHLTMENMVRRAHQGITRLQ